MNATLLLALGMALVVAPAHAQRPPSPPSGARIERPEASRQRAEDLSFTVIVEDAAIQVGEQVRVSVAPAERVARSPFIFSVDFGDGTRPTRLPPTANLVHRYQTAGRFTVSVTPAIPPGREVFTRPVVRNTVTVAVRDVPLTVFPAVAAAGETVAFDVEFESPDPAVLFRLQFDDGTSSTWASNRRFTHAYGAARRYTVLAEMARLIDAQVVPFARTLPAAIQVADVTLAAPADMLVVGQAAMFTVQFAASDPTLRYRVNFGDGSPPSDWSDTPDAVGSYAAAGNYQAHGEIGRVSAGGVTLVASSPPVVVAIVVPAPPLTLPPPGPQPGGGPAGGAVPPRPSPPPTVWWWPYVLVGLVAVLVVYSARHLMASPRPTFELHRDAGAARVADGPHAVRIRLEVRLHPGVDRGRHRVTVDGEELVTLVRRSHG